MWYAGSPGKASLPWAWFAYLAGKDLRRPPELRLLNTASVENHEPVGHSKEDLYRISPVALTLLELLLPDSCQPDLGFRLSRWMVMGTASHPAMARWLREFFGKIHERLELQLPVPAA